MEKTYTILALAALILFASGCSQAKTYGVGIEGGGLLSSNRFSPDAVTVRMGDSVTWTNNDDSPHTVTSDSGSEMQSNTIAPGQTYSHLFLQSGTYTYHCAIHPNMRGTVIVQ